MLTELTGGSSEKSARRHNSMAANALRASLAKLSPEHREVIDLVYYHGKPVKEVAEVVGVGEATVKTRMF